MTPGEAHLNADGSCEVYDTIDEVTSGTWPSVRAWADAWLNEWRAGEYGPACEFVDALTESAPSGVVDVIVTLADATEGDDELLGWVGAGPLEDLVSHSRNSLAVLDDVERAARLEPMFGKALWRVWLGTGDVPELARHRLAELGARDFVAEHAMTEPELAAYAAGRRAKGWDPPEQAAVKPVG
ncbi:MAG: hypothetical protein M3Y42_06125 [Actinomycetota bacterium]|nr:hypothetical protein [Actinomycetota bacterium]MDQ2956522.1 hypothetical protein [Actinomycetota bacterium]